MRFQASLADSCIGTRKRKEFFPGREMLRVRYKNVNRDLTGEIGEDGTNSNQGESRTFLSTILHVFNVVHLVKFLSRLLPAPFCSFPATSSRLPLGTFYLTPLPTPG